MPDNGTPIKLTLYNEQDEEIRTYERTHVPWGILKKAIRLSKDVELQDATALEEADVDAIAGLVVEVFNDQFTIEDLDKGADIQEMLAVIQAIIGRASGLVQANPTGPASTQTPGPRPAPRPKRSP